jgi:hypothetical protein
LSSFGALDEVVKPDAPVPNYRSSNRDDRFYFKVYIVRHVASEVAAPVGAGAPI